PLDVPPWLPVQEGWYRPAGSRTGRPAPGRPVLGSGSARGQADVRAGRGKPPVRPRLDDLRFGRPAPGARGAGLGDAPEEPVAGVHHPLGPAAQGAMNRAKPPSAQLSRSYLTGMVF